MQKIYLQRVNNKVSSREGDKRIDLKGEQIIEIILN